MKNYILAGIAIVGFGLNAQAQTLADAIKKTTNEQFEDAAADFRKLIAQDPNKGEYYFYFGENYLASNNIDSAMIMYKKGAETSPMYPLNHVGVGKAYLYQGKESDANTNIFKAKTLADDKTNKATKGKAYLEIADAYINSPNGKNIPEALKLLKEAQKLEKNNPDVLILTGDALLEQNPTDGGAPIKQYSDAFEMDKKSTKAIIRKGKLYQRAKNYNEALKYYKDAIAIDPNFAPAYRELAEIYTLAARYSESIENWKKYLELNNSPSARVRYAYSLYNAKQYAEASKEIEALLAKDPNNVSAVYLNRVLAFSYYEMGDKTDKEAYSKGLNAINLFFEKSAGKNFNYIPDDYKYKGLLLWKSGKDSLAVLELEKAISLDPKANCELNGEIGKIYIKAKNYPKTIEYFLKKANCEKGLTGQDNFDLGRAYFYGPKDFINADSCFSRLTRAIPGWAKGYFMRAKVNEQLDPKNEKWLAKPFYEKAMETLKPEEKTAPANKNDVVSACEYLGYYYLVMKDNAKAKEYFNLLKTIDPNNKKAKDFFASPAGK